MGLWSCLNVYSLLQLDTGVMGCESFEKQNVFSCRIPCMVFVQQLYDHQTP